MTFWTFLLVFLCPICVEPNPMEQQCDMDTNEKEDCGFGMITESECRLRNCCWKPWHGLGYVPWCVKSRGMLGSQCMLDNSKKVDCGYHGINAYECIKRRCCWLPTSENNTPWCFVAPAPPTTITTTTTTLSTTTEYGIEGHTRLYGDATIGARVEIYHDGRWGTICDDNFGDIAAKIVCKEQGYGWVDGKIAYPEDLDLNPDSPIWLDGFYCSGSEERIVDCEDIIWGSHDCSHDEDAGVICYYHEINEETTEVPVSTTEKALITSTYYIHNDTVKVSDAQNFCEDRNLSLLAIENEFENLLIAEKVNQIGSWDQFCTSGLKNSEGIWEWNQGLHVKPIEYFSWSNDEPDDDGPYIVLEFRGVRWHAVEDTRVCHPVCESEKEKEAKCPDVFAAAVQLYCNGFCGEQWLDNENGCQLSDADAYCKLKLCDINAYAFSFDVVSTLHEPGFACDSYGTNHGDWFGITGVYFDNNLGDEHGTGDVVTNVECKIFSVPSTTPTPTTTTSCTNSDSSITESRIRHLGCWGDDEYDRVFDSYEYVDNDEISIENCARIANENGHSLFGIQYSEECWFSLHSPYGYYNTYGEKDNCVDGLGGGWSLDVYKIVDCDYDNTLNATSSYEEFEDDCPPLFHMQNGQCVPKDFICSNTSLSCYYLELINLDWNDAMTFCQSKNSNLATIESSTENELIVEIIGDRKSEDVYWWLGGTDENHEDEWTWITALGEVPILYSNWEKDQPNNWKGNSNYAAMNDEGLWYNAPENYATVYKKHKMYPLCEYHLTGL